MTARIVRVCIFCTLGLSAAAGDDAVVFPPLSYHVSRYESIMARSPFVLPAFGDNATQPAPVQKNWASDYRIVGIISSGTESIVLAKKAGSDDRLIIKTAENSQGIRLVELQMSVDPREVSAVIGMGDRQGVIRYDDSILANLPRSVVPNNPALKSQ